MSDHKPTSQIAYKCFIDSLNEWSRLKTTNDDAYKYAGYEHDVWCVSIAIRIVNLATAHNTNLDSIDSVIGDLTCLVVNLIQNDLNLKQIQFDANNNHKNLQIIKQILLKHKSIQHSYLNSLLLIIKIMCLLDEYSIKSEKIFYNLADCLVQISIVIKKSKKPASKRISIKQFDNMTSMKHYEQDFKHSLGLTKNKFYAQSQLKFLKILIKIISNGFKAAKSREFYWKQFLNLQKFYKNLKRTIDDVAAGETTTTHRNVYLKLKTHCDESCVGVYEYTIKLTQNCLFYAFTLSLNVTNETESAFFLYLTLNLRFLIDNTQLFVQNFNDVLIRNLMFVLNYENFDDLFLYLPRTKLNILLYFENLKNFKLNTTTKPTNRSHSAATKVVCLKRAMNRPTVLSKTVQKPTATPTKSIYTLNSTTTTLNKCLKTSTSAPNGLSSMVKLVARIRFSLSTNPRDTATTCSTYDKPLKCDIIKDYYDIVQLMFYSTRKLLNSLKKINFNQIELDYLNFILNKILNFILKIIHNYFNINLNATKFDFYVDLVDDYDDETDLIVYYGILDRLVKCKEQLRDGTLKVCDYCELGFCVARLLGDTFTQFQQSLNIPTMA